MTREERFPELRQFFEEYKSLCNQYNCFVSGTTGIVLSIEEAEKTDCCPGLNYREIMREVLQVSETSLKQEPKEYLENQI